MPIRGLPWRIGSLQGASQNSNTAKLFDGFSRHVKQSCIRGKAGLVVVGGGADASRMFSSLACFGRYCCDVSIVFSVYIVDQRGSGARETGLLVHFIVSKNVPGQGQLHQWTCLSLDTAPIFPPPRYTYSNFRHHFHLPKCHLCSGVGWAPFCRGHAKSSQNISCRICSPRAGRRLVLRWLQALMPEG